MLQQIVFMHKLPASVFMRVNYSCKCQTNIIINVCNSLCHTWQMRACDGHETRPYYRASGEECHKGVCVRRFFAPEKSATRLPLSPKYVDVMCFMRLRMANARFRTRCCVYKGGSIPKRRRLHSLVCKGT